MLHPLTSQPTNHGSAQSPAMLQRYTGISHRDPRLPRLLIWGAMNPACEPGSGWPKLCKDVPWCCGSTSVQHCLTERNNHISVYKSAEAVAMCQITFPMIHHDSNAVSRQTQQCLHTDHFSTFTTPLDHLHKLIHLLMDSLALVYPFYQL